MAIKLKCFQCGGSFGLTRRYFRCHAFCSLTCVETYRNKVLDKPPDELIHLLQYPPDKSYDVIS